MKKNISKGLNYTKEVMKYFKNPKNMGEMKKPDAEGSIESSFCGDLSRVMLRIQGNKISDIKFQTYGCAASVASSSVLTELVKGKTISEAKKVSNSDIIKVLKGLPSIKLHCADLSLGALKEAIKNWERKNSKRK
ncbi:iron-sulfur cluster assembly scaffold protein [Candidatus Pacearchaeota archaeon]|nr:iron-sulfur cluster assembly scaffold protein [Candidatus Pacearchaeota archaeon]